MINNLFYYKIACINRGNTKVASAKTIIDSSVDFKYPLDTSYYRFFPESELSWFNPLLIRITESYPPLNYPAYIAKCLINPPPRINAEA